MTNDTKKQSVLDQLKNIHDPDLNQDIVSLNFVKDLKIDDGNVSFKLELTTPACPIKDEFKQQAEELVGSLEWVKRVDVTMTSRSQSVFSGQGGLKNVSSIIAVSSCKGGVGKSTIATNLAFSLAKTGAKVGIFDADIYGPSLPTMVHLDDPVPEVFGQQLKPLEFEGVKLMSFGFIQQGSGEDGPAIMRGPMVTSVINQLLTGTEWGELDYLIIDFPPGTGDIQITLAQIVPITAAVIVTTPQKISFIDVVKGIEMFDKLKIPTIGVVENMSYFVCDGCEKKHRLYGQGALRDLIKQFGFQHAFEMGLDSDLSQSCDLGVPYVMSHPDSLLTKHFTKMTESWVREISKIHFQKEPPYGVDIKGNQLFLKQGDDVLVEHTGKGLRLQCQCAYCVDEFSGEQKVKDSDVSDSVLPLSTKKVGNYAFAVEWSDGHSSLFPIKQLLDAQPVTA